VRENGDAERIGSSGNIVRERVAPEVRAAPGFVSALWLSDGAGHTLNVFVFASEDAARAALRPARDAQRPPFIQVETVDLFTVLATA
jgi:hypothetical protein